MVPLRSLSSFFHFVAPYFKICFSYSFTILLLLFSLLSLFLSLFRPLSLSHSPSTILQLFTQSIPHPFSPFASYPLQLLAHTVTSFLLPVLTPWLDPTPPPLPPPPGMK